MKLRAPLLLLAILTLGCAVQGAPFQRANPPPGMTTIYVYRPYHYVGSLLRPPVTCGDETAHIGPGGYHAFIVPAGKVTCSVEGGETNDETEIDGAPRNYYIREEIGWGTLTGHPHLDPIDDDTAHGEIAQCCVQEDQSQYQVGH